MSNKSLCRVLRRCKDGSIILQDMSYQTRQLKKEEVKKAIMNGQLDVIDLKLSKNGRLLKRKVDLKSVCRQYGCGEMALKINETEKILFYGLAYINSNMTNERKKELCHKIAATGGMDANDIISLFTKNDKWSDDHFYSLDTQCRDRVIYLIYYLCNGRNKVDT